MKVICNRGALLEALSVAGNVVATRTPKPSLQCVKLSAPEKSLTVMATDLEVAIRYIDHQVQIDEPGEALVPADKMRDIVRESVDDTLSIEIAGDNAIIKGQDSNFKIFTQNVAEFPPVPDFEGEPQFEIAGGHLKQLIGQTLFAAAKESSRYAFNGVLVSVKGKKISLVATDGRRLAMAKGDLVSDNTGKDGAKAIIPAKALTLIDKLVDDPEEAVGFQIKENQILVHTSSATLTSSLVEGQFPPFEDVIPKDCDKKMTASTGEPTQRSSMRSPRADSPSRPTGVSRETGSREMVLSFWTFSTGISIRRPISSFVGVRPSSFSSSRVARRNLFILSFMWTGMRMVRDWSAIARVIACRIHHVAYVENL